MTATFTPGAFEATLIGDESLTIACGDMLLAGGHRIGAVVTRDAAVRGWAEAAGLTVLAAPGELLSAGQGCDWLLSVANLRMIPAAVLAQARRGAVNFHDGPLPAYAGLNAPAWAIMAGEAVHGISWHMIEGGVDEGDLLVTREVRIAPDETALSLNARCYAAGVESFPDVLAQLEAGTPQRQPQDLAQRSYFARDDRPEGAGVLDFAKPAAVLSAQVRGLDFGATWNPLAVAKVLWAEGVAVVGALGVEAGRGAPGEVLSVEDGALVLGSGSAAVRLTGLTDLAGVPLSRADLPAVGTVVAGPGAVSEVPDARAEPQFRAALQRAEVLALPLAKAGGGGRAPERQTWDSAGLSEEMAAAVAAVVALHSAGRTAAVLALPGPEDAGPLVAAWRPLAVTVAAEAEVTTLAKDIAAARAKTMAAGGMAADVFLRDPALDPGARPDVALGAGAPVPGAALTLCADGGLYADVDRLSPAAVALIRARLEAAAARLAADGTLRCADLWQAPQAEMVQMLETWNATDRPFDAQTVHGAFEAQVDRTPEAVALVFEDRQWRYGALEAQANRLAHSLRARGVGPGVPVGLFVRRGPEVLIAALGILKAGGAYVPMDPAYPAERIAHFIADSGTPLIVTQADLVAALPEDHRAEVLALDVDDLGQDTTRPDPLATPEDLAYLIYTSGSTGRPKGVMVGHDNVANFFAAMDDRIEVGADPVWLAVTSLSFDISVLELFWTLARGFKLVLAGDESRTEISRGSVARAGGALDFNLFYWGNDDGVGPAKYELLLEGAKFADANGFNAVWTPERHFHAFGGPYPNPSVTGAAVAAVTRNLSVRAGSCVAPLHHPARIAEEWAVIDNLTNGRAGLAIASGWQPDDFVLRPENTPPQNKPAMYAAIEQLRALWAGEAVDFARADGTPHAVVTQPRPVSKQLPIWVTTAGNPATWREAGEIGAHVLTHLLGQSVAEVGEKIGIYHAALRGAGHDPADFTVTVMLHSYLAETREAAEAVAREPMKDYLRSAAGLIKQYAWAFPAFKKPEGATNPFEIDLEGLGAEEMDAILEFAFQRYFNDSGLFGTVADGVARAEELRAIGVTEIACLIDYGIPVPQVLEGLRPLAEVRRQANRAPELAADDFSLAAQIVRHGVSHLQCTPSMAQMLVTNDEARAALRGLRQVLVGGEALPGTLVAALEAACDAVLHNMYGPTETTIWSTSCEGPGAAAHTAPIGTPLANTQVFILDEKMSPQPIGVAGELWIGGAGVTRGYWQRAEMTEARFPANPFGDGRLYRTGDVAFWDAQGCLHFAGRADAQVKIRGHRIEPGEIEARLAALPGVAQAVVTVREGPGGAQLVGYVTLTTGAAAGAGEALRAALAQELPAIMVPQVIMVLAAMPLTPNKKIDRKALPAPRAAGAAKVPQAVSDGAPEAPEAAGVAPEASAGGVPEAPVGVASDATLAALRSVWSGLLGVAEIGPGDNFFDLGGHSLLAVQAHRDIRSALGAGSVSITDIFRFPTLGALAAHLDGKRAGPAAPRAVVPAAPVAGPVERQRPALTGPVAEIVEKRRAMRAGRQGVDG